LSNQVAKSLNRKRRTSSACNASKSPNREIAKSRNRQIAKSQNREFFQWRSGEDRLGGVLGALMMASFEAGGRGPRL
jgi:hypothetical protein